MKEYYQVQGSRDGENWAAFRMDGNMYNVTEDLEYARKRYAEMLEFHKTTYPDVKYHRIVKVKVETEEIERE